MGVALYRKYRSKSLDEIVGQEHITNTLLNGLKEGTTSHAYLFTGPRGVGKTSVARILAHLVNGLEYKDESTHLDIVEIDAASNRRIDEIRELRERVHAAPASAKYKVYIIDEVHMLTREAFNALLKTLEEPPEHVIFILATTEAHKLPDTIISRTQRFNFKPIDKAQAVKHLQLIAKAEKINIDDEALNIIADHGDGSFRDSISLLDQVRGLGAQITAKDVQTLLGIPPLALTKELYEALKRNDKRKVLKHLTRLVEQGFLAHQIAKQLAHIIKSELIDNTSALDPAVCSILLRQLLDVPASHDPDSMLEIILLTAPITQSVKGVKRDIHEDSITTSEPSARAGQKTVEDKSDQSPSEPFPKKQTAATVTIINESIWQEALLALRQKHNTLYTIARMATPRYEADGLVLVFGFPFHQKRMNETKNKQILTDIVNSVLGAPVTITCEVDVDQKKKAPKVAKTPAKTPLINHLDTISNIFGGGEVRES